jgi:uncharacterized phage protein (TIGR01671 family)
MREFKFRVYNKCTKQYIKTCYNHTFAITAEGKIIQYWDHFESPRAQCADLPFLIIQQYTGLKDKNDKEIYEGDILEIYLTGPAETSRPNYGEVVWSNDELRFVLKVIIPTGIVEWGFEYTELKVIGNIYENPELLK